MSESTGESVRRFSNSVSQLHKQRQNPALPILKSAGCRSRSRSRNLSDWHSVVAGAQSPSGIRFRVRLPNVACQP